MNRTWLASQTRPCLNVLITLRVIILSFLLPMPRRRLISPVRTHATTSASCTHESTWMLKYSISTIDCKSCAWSGAGWNCDSSSCVSAEVARLMRTHPLLQSILTYGRLPARWGRPVRQDLPHRGGSLGLCAGDWRIAALGEESQWQWCWCRCRIGLFTCRTLIVLLLPPLSMTQCPRCNPSPPGPIHWQLTPRGHRTRKVVQHHLRQAVLTTTLWNPIYGTLPFLRSSTSTVQPWIQERLYFGSSKEQSFLRLVSCEMFLR